jgi:hypothetical protein
MARTLPFHPCAQPTNGQGSDTLSLPMRPSKADEVSSRNHIALESMRMGKGSLYAAQTLLEAMLVTAFLTEAGHGVIGYEELVESERAICSAIGFGKLSDQWRLGEAGFALFALILTLHDWQLQKVPLRAILSAVERLVMAKAARPF